MSLLSKKLILLTALCVLAQACSLAYADHPSGDITVTASISSAANGVDLLLAGSSGPNEIGISLSADGRSYVIDSSAALDAGGDVCANPSENPNELLCQAPAIASLSFNGGDGDDLVVLGRTVPAPATLRGGSGQDTLVGGAGNDRLIGGPGEDTLIGRHGEDWLYGGAGRDRLVGGPGEDVCVGGPGEDLGVSCETEKDIP